MTSNATSFSFGRWTLVGALLAALGALLAHEVTTRRTYAASLQAMSIVTDDTLPTLLHLTELRRVIRDLDIVKRLVDTHGGAIEVTSRLGQGSTFRVTLPPAGSPRVTARG